MNSRSIEHVLAQMGIHEVKRTGEWLTTTCPLATWTHAGGTDRRPSFGIRETTGISGVHCFSCGFKGGLLSLVRTYGRHAMEDGLMTAEDVKQLEDFVILAEDEDEVAKPTGHATDAAVPGGLRECLDQYHPYFAQRGISEAVAREWGLGYVEDFFDENTHLHMHQRALFPVYVWERDRLELKGVVGRTAVGEEPKYKNAPANFKKARLVYGGWRAVGCTKIVVVEGPVDCIQLNTRIAEAELPEMVGVALLGADPSAEQLDWLKNNAEEVICMLDNDPSGKLGVKKLIDGLEDHIIVSVVRWKDEHKDPDEAGEYALTMIAERQTVLEHRLERLLRKGE